MKKNFILLPLIMFLFTSCDMPTSQSAAKYNDDMLDIQEAVDEELSDFLIASQNYSRAEAEKRFEEVSEFLDYAIEAVKNKEDFDGKDDFKMAVINLLKVYKELLHKEFYLLFVEYGGDYVLSDEEYELYELVYNEFFDKYDSAHEEFDKFQQSFAEKYGFTVVE